MTDDRHIPPGINCKRLKLESIASRLIRVPHLAMVRILRSNVQSSHWHTLNKQSTPAVKISTFCKGSQFSSFVERGKLRLQFTPTGTLAHPASYNVCTLSHLSSLCRWETWRSCRSVELLSSLPVVLPSARSGSYLPLQCWCAGAARVWRCTQSKQTGSPWRCAATWNRLGPARINRHVAKSDCVGRKHGEQKTSSWELIGLWCGCIIWRIWGWEEHGACRNGPCGPGSSISSVWVVATCHSIQLRCGFNATM